jgi:hypothetical protein
MIKVNKSLKRDLNYESILTVLSSPRKDDPAQDAPTYAGLHNLGATCYLNVQFSGHPVLTRQSVVQCLFHLPALRQVYTPPIPIHPPLSLRPSCTHSPRRRCPPPTRRFWRRCKNSFAACRRRQRQCKGGGRGSEQGGLILSRSSTELVESFGWDVDDALNQQVLKFL